METKYITSHFLQQEKGLLLLLDLKLPEIYYKVKDDFLSVIVVIWFHRMIHGEKIYEQSYIIYILFIESLLQHTLMYLCFGIGRGDLANLAHTLLCCSSYKCMFLTNAPFNREVNRLCDVSIRVMTKRDYYNKEKNYQETSSSKVMSLKQLLSCFKENMNKGFGGLDLTLLPLRPMFLHF